MVGHGGGTSFKLATCTTRDCRDRGGPRRHSGPAAGRARRLLSPPSLSLARALPLPSISVRASPRAAGAASGNRRARAWPGGAMGGRQPLLRITVAHT